LTKFNKNDIGLLHAGSKFNGRLKTANVIICFTANPS